MDQVHRVGFRPPPIDLAREPEFSIGVLRVRPSRREVGAGEVRLVLQPRVMQVLVALAHPISEVVSQDELISRCWGGLTVGDDAIARCIGQLRRVAASWPEPPYQIETITSVGYRLTPTASPAAGAPAPRRTPWRGKNVSLALVGTGLVALAAAAAILVLQPWRTGRTAPSAPNPTIAVLNFQPVGSSAGEKALADALPRRVADALSKFNVTVISGTDAGADFAVEGRVTDKDGRLHVTADLSDPHSHVLLYSFDTTVPDGPTADVASEVAGHVALSLDPSQVSNTLGGKLTAADYVLIGRLNDGIARWDLPYQIDQLRRLADRHPQDGDIQGALAAPAIFEAETQAPPGQRAQLLQFARESIGRAGRLDPNSAQIYYAEGFLVNGPMGYPERERLWRRSMSLNPGYHIYMELGELMMGMGRLEEGASLVKRAVQLDPMNLIEVTRATRDMFATGRMEDAAQDLARQEQTWPDHPLTVEAKYSVAYYSGDMQQVLALDRRYHLSSPSRPQQVLGPDGQFHLVQHGAPRALMVEAARARDPASVQRLADDCLREYRGPVLKPEDSVCMIAMVKFGRLDEAFQLASLDFPDNRGFAPPGADAWILDPPPRNYYPGWIFSPALKPLRDDPRFWDFAAHTGLINYWQSTGSWPDFCQPQLDNCKRLAAAAALAHPPQPRG